MEIKTIISIVIYAFFGLAILFGFLRGLRKGFYKSIVDIGVVILDTVLSLVISKLLVKSLMKADTLLKIMDKLQDLISDGEMLEYFNGIRQYITESTDGGAIGAALSLPVAIATPIVFVIIYIVLGLILKIPKLIVERVVFGKNGGKGYRGGNRLCGGACGAVRTLLALAVMLIPLTGFLNLASNTITTVSGSLPEDNSLAEVNSEYIEPISKNIALKVVYNCGGKPMFKTLSTVKVDKTKISLTKEVDVLARIYTHTDSFTDTKPEDYGEEQIREIDEVCSIVDEAQLVPIIISDAVSYTSSKWIDGEKAFGIERPIVGEYYDETLNEILSLFKDMDASSAKRDVRTIAEVGKESIDSGLVRKIITKEEGTFEIVSSEEFLDKVLLEIYDNEHMRPAIPLISKSLVNYIYKVYDKVNETETPLPQPVDISAVSREDMEKEGRLLSLAMRGISNFDKSIKDLDRSDASIFASNADLGSLGEALDAIKASKLFGMGYGFTARAVLKSEICADLKFIDDEMIEAALAKDTNMKELLLTRQHLVIITMSLTGKDVDEESYKNAIKDTISGVTPNTSEAMKSTFSKDKLVNFGMTEEKAETMSKVFSDIVDSSAELNSTLTEEDKEKEAESLDNFMSTMMNAKDSSDKPLFAAEGEESKTGMTSDEFVASVMDSKILTQAVKKSSSDKDDAYGIADTLSEKDKESVKASIENHTTDDEEAKKAMLSMLGLN